MKITNDEFIKLLAAEIGEDEKITKIRLLGVIAEINRKLAADESYTIAGFGTFSMKKNQIAFEPAPRLEAEVNFNYQGLMPVDSELPATDEADDLEVAPKPDETLRMVRPGIMIVDEDVADEEVFEAPAAKHTMADDEDPFGINTVRLSPEDFMASDFLDEPGSPDEAASAENKSGSETSEAAEISAETAKTDKMDQAPAKDVGTEPETRKTEKVQEVADVNKEAAEKPESNAPEQKKAALESNTIASKKSAAGTKSASKAKTGSGKSAEKDTPTTAKSAAAESKAPGTATKDKSSDTSPKKPADDSKSKKAGATTEEKTASKRSDTPAPVNDSKDKDAKPAESAKSDAAKPEPSGKTESKAPSVPEVKPVAPKTRKPREISRPAFDDDEIIFGKKPGETGGSATRKAPEEVAPPPGYVPFSEDPPSKETDIAPELEAENKTVTEPAESTAASEKTDIDRPPVETAAADPVSGKATKSEQAEVKEAASTPVKSRHVQRRPDSSMKVVLALVAVLVIGFAGWWILSETSKTPDPLSGTAPVAGISTAQADVAAGDSDLQSDAAAAGVGATTPAAVGTGTPRDAGGADAGQSGATQTERTDDSGLTPISVPRWEDSRSVAPVLSGMFGLEGEPRVIQGRVYSIIVHSLPSRESANRARDEIAGLGLRSLVVEARGPRGERTWRVGIGQFPSSEEAEIGLGFLPQQYRERHFIARIN